MKKHSILRDGKVLAAIILTKGKDTPRSFHLVPGGVFVALFLLLTSCGGVISNTTGSTPLTPIRVNGFGTAANHPHAFMAFSNHVLVLATHYGTFWSGNDGTSWTEVAGGSGQLMDGLMAYSLTSSPLHPQRLYELTQPAFSDHKGILGLYTSTDQGWSWRLAIAAQRLVSNEDVYLAEAGNDTPEEIYVCLPAVR